MDSTIVKYCVFIIYKPSRKQIADSRLSLLCFHHYFCFLPGEKCIEGRSNLVTNRETNLFMLQLIPPYCKYIRALRRGSPLVKYTAHAVRPHRDAFINKHNKILAR